LSVNVLSLQGEWLIVHSRMGRDDSMDCLEVKLLQNPPPLPKQGNSHQYDRAVEQARRFTEQSPQSTVPQALLSRIYWIQGRVSEAIAERRKIATMVQSAQMMRDQDEVSAAFNKGGIRAAALKAGQLMERDGDFAWASYAYGIGQDASKVVESWEQALRAGDGTVAYSIKTSPEFDFMHGDPRYQEMLRRLDLMQ